MVNFHHFLFLLCVTAGTLALIYKGTRKGSHDVNFEPIKISDESGDDEDDVEQLLPKRKRVATEWEKLRAQFSR